MCLFSHLQVRLADVFAAMEAAYAAEKEAAALVRDAADEAWAMSRPGGIIGGPRASY